MSFLRLLSSCDMMGPILPMGKGTLSSITPLEHQRDVLFQINTHWEKKPRFIG